MMLNFLVENSAARLFVTLFAFANYSQAIPTTSQLALGGGLTILSYNDLSNTPTARSGAILINKHTSFSLASASCNLLGESLWSNDGDKTFALNSSLSYEMYRDECTAINYQGSSFTKNCHTELPALCTQHALVSNDTTDDTSPSLQITHQVNSLSLTGYRDFYTFKFFGVRYAPKPQRFTYSTLYTGTGHENAISSGADCQQYIGQVTSGSSEDCLFLNIWTPYLAPPSSATSLVRLKPVVFYIYGGGFTSGSAGNTNTDGTNLASRGDVVVVALNYRVGFFGFLAYPDGIHNGSYGIGDMVTALEWIHQNIRAFGGDPDQVTIAGESAGAAAVRALLASPKAKGLFRNAIIQSSPDGWDAASPIVRYMSIAQYGAAFTNSALNSTGCLNATNPIDCLSNVAPADLANLQTATQFPVIDGTYLTHHELALNNSGDHNSDVAVMIGINRDELGILVPYPPAGVTIAQWFAALHAIDLDQYPVLENGTALFDIPANPTREEIFNITVRVGGDGLFGCATEALAYSASKHKAFKKTYAYQFNRTYSPTGYTTPWCQPAITPTHPFGDPNLEYYKCHGGEQIYMFGNVRRTLPDRDGLDVPFSQLIVDYWANFARHGNPNPDVDYLKARGYWSTLERMQTTGDWDEVADGKNAWRVLQWDGFMEKKFPEGAQCEFVGLPLTYYENN